MDYSKLSDNDLMALYNNDYSKLSDDGLKSLYGATNNNNNAFSDRQDKYSAIQNDNSLTREQKAERIRAIGEAERRGYEKDRFLGHARTGLGASLEGASYHPIFNIPVVGTAIGGAMSGAGNALIEGKSGGEILGDAGKGALIGASLQALPYTAKLSKPLGKVGGWAFKNSFAGLKPKTVEQLIKPNSKALDLTEETAQNLLMNTTERVQRDYRDLLKQAGQAVNEAALRLPEERGVFASSLKNSLDDIFEGHSVSGVKELNPAFEVAGDVYDDLLNKINLGSDVEGIGKVSAPKLADIMRNIKNYNINWDSSNAKEKQAILKEIYGDFSRRLGNLSPELRKANKEYAKLAKFDDNEGVRNIINPRVLDKGNVDTASKTLRNYNATITSGNKGKNIHDLENLLVKKGKKPFLSDIDDVNAANELLKTVETGINPFGLTDKYKNLIARPLLKGGRMYNIDIAPRLNAVNSFIDKVSPEVLKILTPAIVQKAVEE